MYSAVHRTYFCCSHGRDLTLVHHPAWPTSTSNDTDCHRMKFGLYMQGTLSMQVEGMYVVHARSSSFMQGTYFVHARLCLSLIPYARTQSLARTKGIGMGMDSNVDGSQILYK